MAHALGTFAKTSYQFVPGSFKTSGKCVRLAALPACAPPSRRAAADSWISGHGPGGMGRRLLCFLRTSVTHNPAAPAREPITRVLAEMRTFSVIWLGQLVSSLGSGLTGFALPVWIFQKTGSAEAFGLLFFAAMVPGVLLAPVAGALVDRWDRRMVLLVSDGLAALMTLVLGALLYTGSFEIWHLVVVPAIGSAVGTFQGPAFTAAVGMLVPQRHF